MGDHRQKAGLQIGHADLLDDLRHEDSESDAGSDDAEIDDRQCQYADVGRGLEQRVSAHSLDLTALLREVCRQPFPLCRRQPRNLGGLIPQVGQQQKPRITAGAPSAMNTHCQPLRPKLPSSPRSPVEIGPPTATAIGTRSHGEPGDHPAAVAHWKPRVKIEAGLGGGEQET
jgi:hypothetical protein